MSTLFQITEHVIDCQYVREYPRATATPDAPLKLAVKQYTPVENLNPQPGDVTLVGVHGTGYPKELYEPLWENLLAQAKKNGVRIRAIWMADAANQGCSGILNEQYLGNDPSWYDHSRDLIHMINYFREQMPRPIMGIGHSLGAVQLVYVSLFHPRLLTSLMLIEPHMNLHSTQDKNVLIARRKASLQRDVWPSRAVAVEKARRLFKDWDPRVFQRWTEFGYRDLPTAIHPASMNQAESTAPPVTLSTTKYQELMLYSRPNFQGHTDLGLSGRDAYWEREEASRPHDPLTVPDMLGPLGPGQQFYRPEALLATKLIPHLRSSVLYLSGSRSPLCRRGVHAELVRRTGIGFSGSGGMSHDRVGHVVIESAGHALPLEKPVATAEAVVSWIQQEVHRWKQDEARIADEWKGKSLGEKQTFPPGWMHAMDNLVGIKRSAKI